MRAVLLHEFGGPENLRVEHVAPPKPNAGEVLIKVGACGVCYHDLINRRGDLPRTKLPAILGHEIAGEVIEVGPAAIRFQIGDRVASIQRLYCGACHHCRDGRTSLCRRDTAFFGEEIPGGYAEYVAARETALAHVPDAVPFDRGAIVACTVGTALHTVRTRGRVRRGETVLVTGASGGVGLHVVQIARWRGARVVAVTSSEHKMEALRQAGANEVIYSPDLHFSDAVRRATGGGVDVAIEVLGALSFEASLKSLVPGGRLIVVGNLETRSVSINPGLIILKELEIIGTFATNTSELAEAMDLVASGIVEPVVARTVPLEDAADAHRLVDERAVIGRLVLTMQ